MSCVSALCAPIERQDEKAILCDTVPLSTAYVSGPCALLLPLLSSMRPAKLATGIEPVTSSLPRMRSTD